MRPAASGAMAPRRLSLSLSADSDPVWSPLGDRVAFRSMQGGQPNLYARPPQFAERPDDVVLRSELDESATDWRGDAAGGMRSGARLGAHSIRWRSPREVRCTIAPMADHTPSSDGRTVFCVKFQRQLPGLDAPPWPGELGQRVYEHVSVDAWRLWEERMKMILNEYRLMPFQKEAQELVARHMEEFFFGEGAALPPGYMPEKH